MCPPIYKPAAHPEPVEGRARTDYILAPVPMVRQAHHERIRCSSKIRRDSHRVFHELHVVRPGPLLTSWDVAAARLGAGAEPKRSEVLVRDAGRLPPKASDVQDHVRELLQSHGEQRR